MVQIAIPMGVQQEEERRKTKINTGDRYNDSSKSQRTKHRDCSVSQDLEIWHGNTAVAAKLIIDYDDDDDDDDDDSDGFGDETCQLQVVYFTCFCSRVKSKPLI